MTSIPFLDLLTSQDTIRDDLNTAFDRVVKSGSYILGAELDEFESEFADYCGAGHAVGVGNGLDALRIGLIALGIKPGDEVIVPSHTFIATWLAVTDCKAIPVPVDPEEGSFTISAVAIKKAITSRTRVIIPVHLYGHPVDLDPILSLANEYGIKVLEDAAQAHGARYKGRRIGSHGDLIAWSFYPGKNLGALGDGGALTTNDVVIADSIRMLRNYGSRQKYKHDIEGYNSRLDPLQAAFLRVKLRHLDHWNKQRSEIASIFLESFSNISRNVMCMPSVQNWAEPVWHLFVVQLAKRDQLQAYLTEVGITTLIHYPKPPHLQKAYKCLGFNQGDFPIAEKLSREVLSLPIYPGMNIEIANQITFHLKNFLNNLSV
jgi:dTDP-4-amino-4,6-dideoxygalactose transaminase